MIDKNQIEKIENLKQIISKEFAEKEKANDVLLNTMDLVIKDEKNRYIIRDEQSYVIANELLKIVHELDKKAIIHHAPMKKAVAMVEKTIIEAEKKARGNLITAKGILSAAIGAYKRKIEAEAREKARQEQEWIEKLRLEEAERKIQEAQKLKEEATPDSIQQALNLENEAEDILGAETPVIQIEQPPKVEGTKTVEYWKFQIIDALQIPRDFLKPDETKIGAYVRAMKDKAQIPGVKIYSETKTSVTGR